MIEVQHFKMIYSNRTVIIFDMRDNSKQRHPKQIFKHSDEKPPSWCDHNYGFTKRVLYTQL